MKHLSILALFVWSTVAIAAGPPAGAPLEQLYESAQYETFMPMAERLAATGDAEAQFLLAQAYHLGKGVNEDLSRAIDLYEKAARNGSWRAMSGLGDIMLREGGQPDRAAALFERALKMGGSQLAGTKLTLAHWSLCLDEARGAACSRAAQAYQAEWERTRAEEPLEKALAALTANCEHATRPHLGESGQLDLPPATACAEAVALAERGVAAGSQRFGPEAARSIQAMYARGATPLLEVAHQHYILVLGPAGSKVGALTAAPYPHVHTHGCGCGRHASNPAPIPHSET